MRHVERNELTDYVTYVDNRDSIRTAAMAAKGRRRVQVGVLTFLFENRDTVRYQVLEMMRVERIVRESDIQHELDTYNELLGGPGELGCTLLIEIEDPATRDKLLRDWLALPSHLYALLEDGTRVRPTYDTAQVGDDRLSSVQFLKFDTGGQVPIALGTDLPNLIAEVALSAEQHAALGADLAEG